MKYSEQRKQAILAMMRPPQQQHKIAALAEREEISEATLYKWRSEARDHGQLRPSGAAEPADWSSNDKFNAVLKTAALSEAEIADYCRRHGLYPEQIQHWRGACAQANDRVDQSMRGERAALKGEQARRRRVERVLKRKDAALAETAALLALQKRAQAIWGRTRTYDQCPGSPTRHHADRHRSHRRRPLGPGLRDDRPDASHLSWLASPGSGALDAGHDGRTGSNHRSARGQIAKNRQWCAAVMLVTYAIQDTTAGFCDTTR